MAGNRFSLRLDEAKLNGKENAWSMHERSHLLSILLVISIYLPGRLVGDQGETGFDLLERCRECKLYLTNHSTIQGQLIGLEKEHLEIAVREGPLTRQFRIQSRPKVIPFEEVVKMRCGDPAYDGVIWGSLAGALIGATYLGIKYNMLMEPGYEYGYTAGGKALKGLLMGGGIGMVLGYFLDVEIGYPQETRSIPEWLEEKENID